MFHARFLTFRNFYRSIVGWKGEKGHDFSDHDSASAVFSFFNLTSFYDVITVFRALYSEDKAARVSHLLKPSIVSSVSTIFYHFRQIFNNGPRKRLLIKIISPEIFMRGKFSKFYLVVNSRYV